MEKQGNVSRRNFLTVAAAASSAAVLGLAGCAPSGTTASAETKGGSAGLPESWDYELDVVVVGAGGAGHMAALAAVEEGASAILLEKQGMLLGDTAICACEMCGCWPEQTEKDSGEEDTVEKYLSDFEDSYLWSTNYYLNGQQFEGERVMVPRQIELSPETYQWLTDNAGIEWHTFYDSSWDPQPKWETVKPRNWKATTGLITPLSKLAAEKGIETVLNADVYELLTNNDGRVVGVRAAVEGGRKIINVKASKAVVVSTGSFMGERYLISQNFPEALYLVAGCSTASTGDGHKMVRNIGGNLRDLSLGLRWAPVEFGAHSQMMMGSWYYCGISLPQVPGIFINTEGKRYAAESVGYSFSALEISKQPMQVAYWLVDSVGAENTHLFGDNAVSTAGSYGKGIELCQADTLEELAIKMNIDPAVLTAEVARYNGFVEKGVDEDFGKVMDGTIPIATPPFYALMEQPAPYNTYGGIETDVDSHVISQSGTAIPGLYAAGSCCGSYAEQEGLYYIGGVAQAMVFGRQAGKHAAAEAKWDA